MKNAIVLLLAALLPWQMCLAQVGPWERVQVIAEGKKVQVKTLSKNTVNGKMAVWTPDSLSVKQSKDKTVQLAKSEVTQVVLVIGRSRGQKAGLGLLIGGGACGTLGGVAGSVAESDVAAAGFFAGFGLCGGIAAGIAALFPPHREVIYTASPASKPAN